MSENIKVCEELTKYVEYSPRRASELTEKAYGVLVGLGLRSSNEEAWEVLKESIVVLRRYAAAHERLERD